MIVAAIVLEGTACVQYFSSRAALQQEAERRAMSELRRAELEVNVVAAEVEMSVKSMALMAGKNLHAPQRLYDILQIMVLHTPNMTGAGFTFDPYYYKPQKWFEPYCCEVVSGDKSDIRCGQIGGEDHDYFQAEWYRHGRENDSCLWSEPYYDNAGAKAMLVSCTYPVKDDKGNTVAVAGADVSLIRLKYIADYLQVYPESYYSIESADGTVIVPLPDMNFKRGYQRYEEYIERTGWKLAVVIPDRVVYAELRKTGLIVSVMMFIGLAVLVLLVYGTGRNLIKLVNLRNQQERIESELSIARKIQMALLPTRFPPFPDYPELHAYGEVLPAKEVGGDLFDFYLLNNKLYFCIGDVSGKGVPASLVMAVTRSLFRSFTSYLDNPAQIVAQMNNTLAGEGNEQNMFVTLFLGVLDMSTGSLRYCNAGHDKPICLPSGNAPCTPLDCKANLPLGVIAGFVYAEQETKLAPGDTLFLYTDGLTEAENSAHEQFGMERIDAQLAARGEASPRELIEQMQAAVKAFAGEAEQSDDLTLFALRVNGERVVDKSNTHYSLVMRNDIQQIPTLAEWIEMIGLPPELNMPINLALEEAVSNVMLYAYPGTSGQVLVECDLKNEKGGRTFIFTISDKGIPFDPTQQEEPDVTQSAEDRPIGGLGIFLVKQIMDEVSYERKDEKNILTLVKSLTR